MFFLSAIDIAPETQYANLSSTDYATFYCRTTGLNANWYINGILYSSHNHSENNYLFHEVTERLDDGDTIHDIYLRIRTTAEYNQTAVVCSVFINFVLFSDPVTLVIQGT